METGGGATAVDTVQWSRGERRARPTGTLGGAGPGNSVWLKALERPSAAWRLEEARLLWTQSGARGQEAKVYRVHDMVEPDCAWLKALERPSAAWRLEEGEKRMASLMAQELVEAMGAEGPGEGAEPLQIASALSLAGKWAAEAQVGCSTSDAMESMRKGAYMLAAAGAGAHVAPDEGLSACKVVYRLAAYADKCYRETLMEKSTPEFKTRQMVIQHKKRQMEQLRSFIQGQLGKLRRVVEADEAANRSLQDNELRYRDIALDEYKRCLQVPTYKFVSLTYQLASRISPLPADNSDGGFQRELHVSLIRLAQEHPYHTLFHLSSLKNGNLGPDGKKIKGNEFHGIVTHSTDLDKVNTAEELMQRVAKRSQQLSTLIQELKTVVDAYIELASMAVPPGDAPMTFPSSIRRRILTFPQQRRRSKSAGRSGPLKHSSTLKGLPLTGGVQPSGQYPLRDLPIASRFHDQISFVGGINKPKLVKCFDANGKEYKLLVKGGMNDDMRQDAVMQQFFGLVNDLLVQDR
eukprot:gene15052-21129_t